MKKNIIIIGDEESFEVAYKKLKKKSTISLFVSRNAKSGSKLYEIPLIPMNILKNNSLNDIVICNQDYYSTGNELRDIGITDFYILNVGFLYHTCLSETMQPYEIFNYRYYKKKHKDEITILYLCRTVYEYVFHFAKAIKKSGYTVILMYVIPNHKIKSAENANIFEDVIEISAMKSVIDFLKNSDIDLIHCCDNLNILQNIASCMDKPIINDCTTRALNDLLEMQIEDIVLGNMSMENCDGIIYSTDEIMNNKKCSIPSGIPKFILNKNTYEQKKFQANLSVFYEKIITQKRMDYHEL